MPAAERVNQTSTVAASWLRPLGLILSLGCVAGAVCSSRVYGRDDPGWWLLGAALVVSLFWQRGLSLSGSAQETRAAATSRERVLFGGFVAACGAGLWAWATYALYHNWIVNFDGAWIAWVLAAVLLSIGLDMMWGRWGPLAAVRRMRRLHLLLLVLGLLAAAAVYRLGNIATFPGEGHISQIEELQNGLWGSFYVKGGGRNRWEYIGHMWLAALGIGLGGPTLLSMRVPFAAISALKALPLFLWLRFSVGTAAAVVATALFASSSWDVVLSRIPTNPNAFIVAAAFALLAGPARRGRPSAYVWLGFLGGYILFEYVVYRPLAVFVLIGAAAMSLRDNTITWRRRLARPLITLVLIVSIGIPLFVGQLWGPRFRNEYVDGWNRARLQAYYNPGDTWSQAITKRVNRSFDTAGLFFFHGEAWQAHNIGGRPLVDPVTATLIMLGTACGLVHFRRGVLGLTVGAFGVTLAGALVVTGNLDVGRAGGTVPYAYALAGYGAASVIAVLEGDWGRIGRRFALIVLAVAVLAATVANTRFLFEFWQSPVVHEFYFRGLASLSTWLRLNTRKGEHVVGIAPGEPNVLQLNDAYWLLGGNIPGAIAVDVESALRGWASKPSDTLLVVFAGPTTRDIKQYLEWLLPGLAMQLERLDSVVANTDIASAHLHRPPPELFAGLATWNCRGVQSVYEVIGAAPEEVLARTTTVAPFIDTTSWPGALRTTMYNLGEKVKQVRVKLQTTFAVQDEGDYAFILEANAGRPELRLDGKRVDTARNAAIHLDGNAHSLEVTGSFEPVGSEVMMRLSWRGADSHDAPVLMPLYRLAVADPACANAANGEQPPP
jgi:hypothetical protein